MPNRKYCSPQCPARLGQREGIEKRFWDHVNKTQTCWLWTGALKGDGRNTYGMLKSDKGNFNVAAHRTSWELHNGPIPEGLQVCHKCDIPRCVNPDHLFLGTASDNQQDAWAKGRRKPIDNRGERHGMSKLTTEKVLAIRSEFKPWTKGCVDSLAEKFGVSRSLVYAVIYRARWAHI